MGKIKIPRLAGFAIGLIALGLIFVIDEVTDSLAVHILYFSVVLAVSNFVGGTYSAAFAVLAAAVRSGSSEFADTGNLLEALWRFFNLAFVFSLLDYLIRSKNKAVQVKAHEALTDSLTELPNRRGFITEMERMVAHSNRFYETLSVAYIDVDNFKSINDTYGHKVGDDLLCCAGRVIQECLRADDYVARLGGDEFGVLLLHTDSGVAELIKRIKAELDVQCRFRKGFPISFSIGVVNYNGRYQTNANVLLSKADAVMYEVKRSGKDAIRQVDFSDTQPSVHQENFDGSIEKDQEAA